MRYDNPYDSYPCIYCNGGCHCTGDAHHLMKSAEQRAVDEANCERCDVCDGTGELSAEKLEAMAREYKADEAFAKAWRKE
jgi:hypothetical protein